MRQISKPLTGLKKQLSGDLTRAASDFFPLYLKGRNRSATYQLCLEFGQFLVADEGPEKLFRLRRQDLSSQFTGFFNLENPQQ
jgi:hypothetical protein